MEDYLTDQLVHHDIMNNYYKVFGLSPNASREEIEQAFKNLILDKEFDVNQNPYADINYDIARDIFEVLSDPIRRVAYHLARLHVIKLERDLKFSIPVLLNELYTGIVLKAEIKRPIVCWICSGYNSENCVRCKGRTYNIEEDYEILSIPKGFIKSQFTWKIDIHVKSDEGYLTFVLDEQPHPMFRREGTDLYSTVFITPGDMIKPFNLSFTDLGGYRIEETFKFGKIEPTKVVMLRYAGFPIYNENIRGNLYIVFKTSNNAKDQSQYMELTRTIDETLENLPEYTPMCHHKIIQPIGKYKALKIYSNAIYSKWTCCDQTSPTPYTHY